MKRAFAVPAFRRLFVALAATMIADSVLLLCLGIWAKTLTGSSAAAGLTIFFLVLPSLAAPLLGWVVDHFSRRGFLLVSYPLAALSLAPLLAVDSPDRLWIIYLVAVLYGVALATLPAADSALIKLTVPDDDLVAANAAASSFREGLRLVGPLIGAALFGAFGIGAVVGVVLLGYAVATAAIAGVRPAGDIPHESEQHWRAELVAGFTHLHRDRLLRYPVLAMAAAVFAFGFTEPLVFTMLDAFGKPATFLGVLISVQGVGALAGGLASTRIVDRLGSVRSIVLATLCCAMGMAVGAAAPALWVLMLAFAAFGFGLPVTVVAMNTLLQRRTPDRLMGRVMTAFSAMVSLPQVVAIGIGAPLSVAVDWRLLAGALALALAGIALALLGWDRRGGSSGRTPAGVSSPGAAGASQPVPDPA